MRQLKIDLTELEMAFDSGNELISYYLDLETGDIISISDEERSLVESTYKSYYDEESQTVEWEEAFQEEPVPNWQRERLLDLNRVKAGFGSRFIAIPSTASREGYRDMEAFITTVGSPPYRNAWNRPLAGAALSGPSRMCCWTIPPSGNAGSNFNGCDYTTGYSSG